MALKTPSRPQPAKSHPGLTQARKILSIIVLTGLGLGIGYLIGRFTIPRTHHNHLSTIQFLGLIVELLVIPFIAIGLHEFGHYLAGRFVGFKFYLFVVGPLRIERNEQDRIMFKFNREISSWGGLCGMYPPDRTDVVSKFSRFVAGGPLASLALAALGLSLGLYCYHWNHEAGSAMIYLGAISGGVAIVTSIPMKNGAYVTDGARWLRLRSGGTEALRDACTFELIALQMQGVPARQWPDELFEQLSGPSDGSIFEGFLLAMSYFRELDRGQVEIAREALYRSVRVFAQNGKALGQYIQAEQTWFDAWYGNLKIPEIELNSPAIPKGTRLRAECALAYRMGDLPLAKALLAMAYEALPDLPMNLWSRTRLDEMRTLIQISPKADHE